MDEERIRYLTHEEFVNEYKSDKLKILQGERFGYILSSPFFPAPEKVAYYFYYTISLIFLLILPVILLIFKQFWLVIWVLLF